MTPSEWDDEPEAPELCEHCGNAPARYNTVEGWLCGPCDQRLNPREEGDDE